ncbi:MAG: aminotransferase class I/II-fold pyridoxal phosphate-dependent enzyme [Pseudomonadota bacterium]
MATDHGMNGTARLNGRWQRSKDAPSGDHHPASAATEQPAALIARLRARKSAHDAEIDNTRASPGGSSTALSQTTLDAPVPQRPEVGALPAARALQLQRAALAACGLENPFFRRHEGPPAATGIIDGTERLSFTSYDYLGLNAHPAARAAAAAAAERDGISAGASRLVGGERAVQRALEGRLASLYDAEDAVAMVSGHATNVTAIGTLMGPGDLILMDALAHNSVHEGARLSGASRRLFPHNDLARLEGLLEAERPRHKQALIAVEGLYSMDGDSPDLASLIAIARRHGAWLMVDEAHSLGVLGATGRGLAEAQGIDPGEVDLWMGTLSKTLGASGGYLAGSAALIDLMRHTAPGFVFSVGLSPPIAAAAASAVDLMLAEPWRVERLQATGARFVARASATGLDTGPATGHAVIPVMLGSSLKAVALSQRLFEAGIDAAPIVHPAVPENAARLRFFITARHAPEEIDHAVDTTARLVEGLDDWVSSRLGAA